MESPVKICFVGSGSISTALGNILALKEKYEVKILSIENEVVKSINTDHVNAKYFPNIELHHSLIATRNTVTLG